MLCTSSVPIVPYIVALQCIAALILPVVLLVLFRLTSSKNEFPPAVRTVSLAALLVVFAGGVVLAIVYAGEPCPQPTLSP